MATDVPLLERVFELEPSEQAYQIARIEGTIPAFVKGTFYLNGPARFRRSELQYRNWLDGDGMVCALRFDSGRVHFANQFVRGTKWVAEEAVGRPLFRTFGTTFAGACLKRGIALESPVNVSVYPYRGTLLAFGEQGLPWELDPVTLETRGVFNFGGRLNEISPFAGHPKFDPATGELFNFGISFSPQHPRLHLYRFNAQAEMLYRKNLPIDYPCSVHDFSLSPTYAVFYLSPYLLDIERMIYGGQTLIDAMQWEPEWGSQLFLVSRETGAAVMSIPIGQRYCLHLINCFEYEHCLMVDVLEYDQPIYPQYQVVPDLFKDVGAAQPVRFVIDRHNGELIERHELNAGLALDFPSIDPIRATSQYRDFWMLGIGAEAQEGRKFFNQLVHAAWAEENCYDVYQSYEGTFLGGEPGFIGNPSDRGDGVVICQLFNAAQSESAFALFDAFHTADGPLAVIHLEEPIPLLFHTSFRHQESE
jgi:all-trans-8'-apo-beta-carotenal 15,15'-oxygenase